MDRWLLTFFIGAILSLFLAEVPAVSQLFLLFFVAISTCFHKTLRYSSGLWFGALWMLGNGYAYQQQFIARVWYRSFHKYHDDILAVIVDDSHHLQLYAHSK